MTTTKNNLRSVVVAHCEGLLQQFENDHPQVVARQFEYPYSEWLTPGADGFSQEFHNMVEDESRIMWFLWNRPDDPTLSAGIEDWNLDSYYALNSVDQLVPMIEIFAME